MAAAQAPGHGPARRPGVSHVGFCAATLYGLLALWVPLLPDNLHRPGLDLGKITGYSWSAASTFGALVLVLFGLYAFGYWLVARGEGSLAAVFVPAGLACLALVFAYPATALDVFGYVARGRLLAVHGVNPLQVPPSARPQDPIVGYLAFPGEPSQYGPLWELTAALLALMAGGDLLREVLLYKALGAAVHLANAALIFSITRPLQPSGRAPLTGAYLFVMNPLLLWEMVGNAHNDGLMVLLTLASIWLLVRGGLTLVLPMAALAGLVKLPAAILLPLLWIAAARRSVRAASTGTLAAATVVVLLYMPFWHGPGTISALGRGGLFTASLGSVLRLSMSEYVTEPLAALLVRVALQGLFAALYVVLLRGLWATPTTPRVIAGAYAALLAAVLIPITWFQAWYVVWPAALGALLPAKACHRDIGLLSLGAMASYVVFIYLWVMRAGGVNDGNVQYVAFGTIVGPLLAGRAMALWRHRTRRSVPSVSNL